MLLSVFRVIQIASMRQWTLQIEIELEFFLALLLSIVVITVFITLGFVSHYQNRQQAETKYDIHENYLSLLNNYDGMAYRCINDQFWTMKYVSKKTFELIGYTEKEIIDNQLISFEEVIVDKYRLTLREQWNEVLATHGEFRSEYQIRTKRGQIKWVSELGHAIYDLDGNVLFIEGFITDITNQKEQLISELKMKAKYQTLIESSQDPIYLASEGQIIYANDACVRFFRGKSKQDIVGLLVEDLIMPDFLTFFRERMDRITATKMPNPSADYMFQRLDGSIAYAEVNSSPTFEGDNMEICVFIHDLTEKRQNEMMLRKVQKRNHDLITEMKEGIGVFEVLPDRNDATLVFMNKGLRSNLAMKEELLGLQITELFPTIDSSERKEIFDVLNSQAVLRKQIRVGQEVIELKFFTNIDKELVMMVSNITEITKAMQEIREQKTRLEQIILGTDAGTWEWDIPSDIIVVNRRWASLIGYTYEEIKPHNLNVWESLVHPDDLPSAHDALTRHLRGETNYYQTEFRMKHKNGTYIWILDRGQVTQRDNQGNPLKMFGTHQDITTRKEKEFELERVSYHDFLTGLYNRRALVSHLGMLSQKGKLPISLAMADVNGLKITNDAFGHQAGDDLLMMVSRIITTNMAKDDFVARTGGDEFVIVMSCPLAEAEKRFKKISSILDNTLIRGMRISVAFGLAEKTSSKQTFEGVIRKAEIEMYNRKMSTIINKRSDTIHTILETLFEKNPMERNHAENVSMLCKRMGSALGYSSDEIDILASAGLLHDIGKVALDTDLLQKPKPNHSEWRQINMHSEIGYRLLASTDEYKMIANDILHHHENYDGTGYPFKIKGEEIPIRSRILAICNSYDSMISDNFYQKKLTVDDAIQELIKSTGKQFDPHLMEVFLHQVLNRNEAS